MPNYRLTCTLSDGRSINAGTINVPSGGGGGYLYIDGESFSGENPVGNDTFYEFLVHLYQGHFGVGHDYGNILFAGLGQREGRMYIRLLFCDVGQSGWEYDAFTSNGLIFDIYADQCSYIQFIDQSEVYKLIAPYVDDPLGGISVDSTIYADWMFKDIDDEQAGTGIAMSSSDGRILANLILASLYAGDDMVQINEKGNIKATMGITANQQIQVDDIEGVRHKLADPGDYGLLGLFSSSDTWIAYLERKFM